MNELLLQLDVAQLVGLIAAFICISAFLYKDEKKFKNTLLLYCIVGSVHFFMMNAYIAAMSAILNAIRIHVSKKTKSTLVMFGFILAFLIICSLNFTHLYELLPIIGSIVGTYGLFKLNGVKLRLSFLFNTLCWLTHNVYIGSIGGVLLEVTVLFVSLVTIFRLNMQQKGTARLSN